MGLWGFQGWRNFPLAKLSPAKLSPGEIPPPPCIAGLPSRNRPKKRGGVGESGLAAGRRKWHTQLKDGIVPAETPPPRGNPPPLYGGASLASLERYGHHRRMDPEGPHCANPSYRVGGRGAAPPPPPKFRTGDTVRVASRAGPPPVAIVEPTPSTPNPVGGHPPLSGHPARKSGSPPEPPQPPHPPFPHPVGQPLSTPQVEGCAWLELQPLRGCIPCSGSIWFALSINNMNARPTRGDEFGDSAADRPPGRFMQHVQHRLHPLAPAVVLQACTVHEEVRKHPHCKCLACCTVSCA